MKRVVTLSIILALFMGTTACGQKVILPPNSTSLLSVLREVPLIQSFSKTILGLSLATSLTLYGDGLATNTFPNYNNLSTTLSAEALRIPPVGLPEVTRNFSEQWKAFENLREHIIQERVSQYPSQLQPPQTLCWRARDGLLTYRLFCSAIDQAIIKASSTEGKLISEQQLELLDTLNSKMRNYASNSAIAGLEYAQRNANNELANEMHSIQLQVERQNSMLQAREYEQLMKLPSDQLQKMPQWFRKNMACARRHFESLSVISVQGFKPF